MYGLIGKIISTDRKRDELIEILIDGSKNMPGNHIYIVSKDVANPNGIWITEVWDTKTSHQNSLKLESIKKAISKGKPMISTFEQSVEITPIGGMGLQQ